MTETKKSDLKYVGKSYIREDATMTKPGKDPEVHLRPADRRHALSKLVLSRKAKCRDRHQYRERPAGYLEYMLFTHANVPKICIQSPQLVSLP